MPGKLQLFQPHPSLSLPIQTRHVREQAFRSQVANKARGPNPALHLILSGLVPRFYLVAALSSHLTVKEYYIYTVLKLHSAL